MAVDGTEAVFPIGIVAEQARNRGMVDRLVAVIRDDILLADICDVARFTIFREQMVEGLVPIGAHVLGNGLIPFLAIGEDRIDVEYHSAKTEEAMLHYVANTETSVGNGGSVTGHAGAKRTRAVHAMYVGGHATDTRKMPIAVLGKGEFIR